MPVLSYLATILVMLSVMILAVEGAHEVGDEVKFDCTSYFAKPSLGVIVERKLGETGSIKYFKIFKYTDPRTKKVAQTLYMVPPENVFANHGKVQVDWTDINHKLGPLARTTVLYCNAVGSRLQHHPVDASQNPILSGPSQNSDATHGHTIPQAGQSRNPPLHTVPQNPIMNTHGSTIPHPGPPGSLPNRAPAHGGAVPRVPLPQNLILPPMKTDWGTIPHQGQSQLPSNLAMNAQWHHSHQNLHSGAILPPMNAPGGTIPHAGQSQHPPNMAMNAQPPHTHRNLPRPGNLNLPGSLQNRPVTSQNNPMSLEKILNPKRQRR